MLDELRDRIMAHLEAHSVGVFGAERAAGAWALPVRYRLAAPAGGGPGPDLVCLVPRWADPLALLDVDPRVLVIVGELSEPLTWLQIRGHARPVTAPDWGRLLPGEAPARRPADRYVALRMAPERFDLIDERRGWGVRETLEF